MGKERYFTEEQEKILKESIADAERLSSGEVRIHIANACKGSPLNAASKVFKSLKMHKTDLRNGVLIYFCPSDKKIAIIGDSGINELVGQGFWDTTLEQMREDFKVENYTGGLQKAVLKVGENLKKYFPYQEDDQNELSDEISYDDV